MGDWKCYRGERRGSDLEYLIESSKYAPGFDLFALRAALPLSSPVS
jgi:hypothetical protein